MEKISEKGKKNHVSVMRGSIIPKELEVSFRKLDTQLETKLLNICGNLEVFS